MSPNVYSSVSSKRSGLLELLANAKDGDVIEPLWITIDPFNSDYTPTHPVPHTTAILKCEGARIEAYITSLHRPSRLHMNLSEYVQYLDEVEVSDLNSAYQQGGNSELLQSRWAKSSFTHYYALNRLTPSAQLNEQANYYRDFSGENSPLPDVVAREFSYSMGPGGISYEIGRTTFIDKFGNGYISWRVGVGPELPSMIPLSITYLEGYVTPPVKGDNADSLRSALIGDSFSFEGNGSFDWYSSSNDPLGYSTNGGSLQGPYNWGVKGWDFLDKKAGSGVAVTPDNGCNCGG